jgi:hypothetical protein
MHVRTVALTAVLRQDRSHIAIELYDFWFSLLGGRGLRRGAEEN